MRIDEVIVLFVGIVGIAGTYWFFLKKKEYAVDAHHNEVTITVEGGYSPGTITVPKGKTTKLHFFRKDPSSCLEEIVLSDFKVRKALPLNETTTIAITPEKAGTFGFTCGMNMFHGKLIVTD